MVIIKYGDPVVIRCNFNKQNRLIYKLFHYTLVGARRFKIEEDYYQNLVPL